jgi:hypothetical protein
MKFASTHDQLRANTETLENGQPSQTIRAGVRNGVVARIHQRMRGDSVPPAATAIEAAKPPTLLERAQEIAARSRGTTTEASSMVGERVGLLKADAARAEATVSEILIILDIERSSVFDASGKFLVDGFESEVAKILDQALVAKVAESAPAAARFGATPTLDAELKSVNASFRALVKPKTK